MVGQPLAREVRALGQELPLDLRAEGRGALIWLMTRLLMAQAAAAVAIGLLFRLGRPGLGEPGPGEAGPAARELGQA
jgi:hypothetical protein